MSASVRSGTSEVDKLPNRGPSLVEVRFNVTDSQHMLHSWRVCDPYLNAVLQREVVTVSPVDGAVEVSVRTLAHYIDDAEKRRNAATGKTAASANPQASLACKQTAHADSQRTAAHPQPPPPLSSQAVFSTSHAQPTDDAASSCSSFTSVDADKGGDGNNVHEALIDSVLKDGTLFFALAKELYELSRNPYHDGGRAGDVYTLEDHCPGFRRCCLVFGDVYGRHVRPVADRLPDFSSVSVKDLLWYRTVVRDTFKLRPDDPNMTGPSESNLDSDWANEHVNKDPYFFREHARRSKNKMTTKPSVTDVTLSYVPFSRKTKSRSADNAEAGQPQLQEEADATTKENSIQTYYPTALLQNPSWEPDSTSTQCRQCRNHFKSVAWPFGVGAHHCRSCGHRLCSACITHKAHRSFAKLSKPGISVEEPDLRLVCDVCYEAYLSLERYRYLGALFAFGGLDFANLSLCRTVSRQWRHAAELCISEYRLLLHQCDPDMKSVLTPVGALLQNSVHLIASSSFSSQRRDTDSWQHRRPSANGSPTSFTNEGLGSDQESGRFLVSLHPEPALLLLKFIENRGQWDHPTTRELLSLLSQCTPGHFGGRQGERDWPSSLDKRNRRQGDVSGPGARHFSHWHFFCTSCCNQMLPAFFAVKAAERISAAPAACSFASHAVTSIARNLLSPKHVLRNLNMLGELRTNHLNVPKSSRLPFFSTTAPQGRVLVNHTSPEHTAAAADSESVVMWLLDLLFRDAAERDPGKRRFQGFLEAALPPLAAASVPLTIIALCSLQSYYTFRNYDEELLGLWRTRIWEEVGSGWPDFPNRSPPLRLSLDPPSMDQVEPPKSAATPNRGAEDARADKGDIQRTLEATMDFFVRLDQFCAQPAAGLQSVTLSRWIKEYCSPAASASGGQAPHFAVPSMNILRPSETASPPRPTNEPSSMYWEKGQPPLPSAAAGTGSSFSHRGLAKGLFVDLPRPIFNPFKPNILLKSIRVSSIRVEETSSTRPVWLTFSTFADADREAFIRQAEADKAAAKNGRTRTHGVRKKDNHPQRSLHVDPAERASKGSPRSEQLFEILYKRENAERDQLMCICGRLIQRFLKDEIGDAQLTNYSVLPLSCDSALIEKADGYVLSKLPGTSSSADIMTFLNTLGDDARRNFLASAKVFLLMNYMFSIGDRHQGNVMVSFNGAILHIDFGFIFSEKTFVEKIAGTTMRIDNQFLAAVVNSRRILHEKNLENQQHHDRRTHHGVLVTVDPSPTSLTYPTPRPATVPIAAEYDEFFNEAADWFLALRPHAAEFYDLWLYATNRFTLHFEQRQLAAALDCLFDRSASRESSRLKFASTMRQSINVCRLKDVTHSSAQVLRSYSDQVSKKFTDGGYEVARSLGALLGSLTRKMAQ